MSENVGEGVECWFMSCRHNIFGVCGNDEKRKECVDISKQVLCMEDEDGDSDGGTNRET